MLPALPTSLRMVSRPSRGGSSARSPQGQRKIARVGVNGRTATARATARPQGPVAQRRMRPEDEPAQGGFANLNKNGRTATARATARPQRRACSAWEQRFRIADTMRKTKMKRAALPAKNLWELELPLTWSAAGSAAHVALLRRIFTEYAP